MKEIALNEGFNPFQKLIDFTPISKTEDFLNKGGIGFLEKNFPILQKSFDTVGFFQGVEKRVEPAYTGIGYRNIFADQGGGPLNAFRHSEFASRQLYPGYADLIYPEPEEESFAADAATTGDFKAPDRQRDAAKWDRDVKFRKFLPSPGARPVSFRKYGPISQGKPKASSILNYKYTEQTLTPTTFAAPYNNTFDVQYDPTIQYPVKHTAVENYTLEPAQPSPALPAFQGPVRKMAVSPILPRKVNYLKRLEAEKPVHQKGNALLAKVYHRYVAPAIEQSYRYLSDNQVIVPTDPALFKMSQLYPLEYMTPEMSLEQVPPVDYPQREFGTANLAVHRSRGSAGPQFKKVPVSPTAPVLWAKSPIASKASEIAETKVPIRAPEIAEAKIPAQASVITAVPVEAARTSTAAQGPFRKEAPLETKTVVILKKKGKLTEYFIDTPAQLAHLTQDKTLFPVNYQKYQAPDLAKLRDFDPKTLQIVNLADKIEEKDAVVAPQSFMSMKSLPVEKPGDFPVRSYRDVLPKDLLDQYPTPELFEAADSSDANFIQAKSRLKSPLGVEPRFKKFEQLKKQEFLLKRPLLRIEPVASLGEWRPLQKADSPLFMRRDAEKVLAKGLTSIPARADKKPSLLKDLEAGYTYFWNPIQQLSYKQPLLQSADVLLSRFKKPPEQLIQELSLITAERGVEPSSEPAGFVKERAPLPKGFSKPVFKIDSGEIISKYIGEPLSLKRLEPKKQSGLASAVVAGSPAPSPEILMPDLPPLTALIPLPTLKDTEKVSKRVSGFEPAEARYPRLPMVEASGAEVGESAPFAAAAPRAQFKAFDAAQETRAALAVTFKRFEKPIVEKTPISLKETDFVKHYFSGPSFKTSKAEAVQYVPPYARTYVSPSIIDKKILAKELLGFTQDSDIVDTPSRISPVAKKIIGELGAQFREESQPIPGLAGAVELPYAGDFLLSDIPAERADFTKPAGGLLKDQTKVAPEFKVFTGTRPAIAKKLTKKLKGTPGAASLESDSAGLFHKGFITSEPIVNYIYQRNYPTDTINKVQQGLRSLQYKYDYADMYYLPEESAQYSRELKQGALFKSLSKKLQPEAETFPLYFPQFESAEPTEAFSEIRRGPRPQQKQKFPLFEAIENKQAALFKKTRPIKTLNFSPADVYYITEANREQRPDLAFKSVESVLARGTEMDIDPFQFKTSVSGGKAAVQTKFKMFSGEKPEKRTLTPILQKLETLMPKLAAITTTIEGHVATPAAIQYVSETEQTETAFTGGRSKIKPEKGTRPPAFKSFEKAGSAEAAAFAKRADIAAEAGISKAVLEKVLPGTHPKSGQDKDALLRALSRLDRYGQQGGAPNLELVDVRKATATDNVRDNEFKRETRPKAATPAEPIFVNTDNRLSFKKAHSEPKSMGKDFPSSQGRTSSVGFSSDVMQVVQSTPISKHGRIPLEFLVQKMRRPMQKPVSRTKELQGELLSLGAQAGNIDESTLRSLAEKILALIEREMKFKRERV